MLPGLIATMWRKSSRPAPDLVRRTPTSGFRTSSTGQRPTWTTPERQRPNSLCGSPPLCLLVPLLPAWQRRRADKRVSNVIDRAKTDLDNARKAAAKLSLWLTAALLIGAFAASLAATQGGKAGFERHRPGKDRLGQRPKGSGQTLSVAHRRSAYWCLCCQPGSDAGRKSPGFQCESYRRVGRPEQRRKSWVVEFCFTCWESPFRSSYVSPSCGIR